MLYHQKQKQVSSWPGIFCPNRRIRPGEKIHEEMITDSDSYYTWDLGKYYTILPATHRWKLEEFVDHFKAQRVPKSFKYNSGENTEWETVDSLRNLIKEHVDPTFKV